MRSFTTALAAALFLVAFGGAASAHAEKGAQRYRGANGDAKLRLAIKDRRVVNIVFSGETECTSRGEPVEPYFGTGVTSGFNDTKLRPKRRFRSHQEYRLKNPLHKGRLPFDRAVIGQIHGPTAAAEVAIRFKTPVDKKSNDVASCRTGKVPFQLERVVPG